MQQWTFIVAVLGAALAAHGQVTASLAPAPEQPSYTGAYRQARLEVANKSSATIEQVTLIPDAGPRVRYPLAVSAGASAGRNVLLPAMAAAQQYTLQFAGADGGDLAEARASITWPSELVTFNLFVDESYAPFLTPSEGYSPQVRGLALLVLCMFVVAAAGALFARTVLVRAAVVTVLAALASVAVMKLPPWPPAVQVRQYWLILDDPGVPEQTEGFAVLNSLRHESCQQQIGRGQQVWPVYTRPEQARGETFTWSPESGVCELQLAPDRPRIVRPGWRHGRYGDVAISRGGKVFAQQQDGRLHLTGVIVGQPAALIYDDSFWRVSGGKDVDRWIDLRSGSPVWELTGRDQSRELTADERRLLEYWRRKYQRAGQAYLVWSAGRAADVGLAVMTVPAPSTQPATAIAPAAP